MTDSSPQTITLPLPAIEGMTIAFQGVNYLRPEKMLDFATISPAVRAVTPLALLYSTVGVLRQVELRKPFGLYQRSGGVPYLVVNHAGPAREADHQRHFAAVEIS